ncbi:MAG: ThuA domain-containing protein [Candidatus Rokubacteria bacterium]|nr:ThuA domain-containing protein [Candidatus Rokubacteria bacterium]
MALGVIRLLCLSLGALALPALTQPASKPPRLLIVTHSAGFQHDVVRRPVPGRLSIAEQVVAELGRRTGAFEVSYVHTRDEVSALRGDSFQAFQAVLFFTTGSLPLTAEARQGLFDAVRTGRGFIGVHSATDTWYDVPEYGELLGGYFDGHPWHERVRLSVEDPAHPATRHLGGAFEITDEIYQFRNWSRGRVRVLLSLDPRSVDVRKGKRPDQDYALAWVRQYGQGRVFYTALGHRPEVWEDERFRQHLLGGIHWAMGLR